MPHVEPVLPLVLPLARRFFGHEDPLGRTIRLQRLAAMSPAPLADPTFEIVGVVRDTANQGPRDLPGLQAFVPFTLRPVGLRFVVRTTGDPMQVLPGVRQQIQAVDRQAALGEPPALGDLIHRVFYARPRFSLLVPGIFAVTGMGLVAFGIYGVLAYRYE